MGKVRLKSAGDGQRPLSLEGAGTPIPLSPLNISGLVIQRAELVEALRPFVPLLSDVVPFEDGEQFLLVLKQPREESRESQGSRGQKKTLQEDE